MLQQLLRHTLEIAPDRPILECDGPWTTAAELERLTSRLASGLAAMGLEEGDRVALLLTRLACSLPCPAWSSSEANPLLETVARSNRCWAPNARSPQRLLTTTRRP